MKQLPILITLLSILLLPCVAHAAGPAPGRTGAPQTGLPECEWCGADEAPAVLSWRTTIPRKGEPGKWLTISGRVFKSDGKTPAAGVVLYVYQTNARGIYPKRGNETGNGKRHGYLRGWMKTGPDGRYQFTTIRPGPYPGRGEPAHIHLNVKPPGQEEYWLDSFHFSDDPLLTDDRRARLENRGGSGILTLSRDSKGRLHGSRDIVLMK